MSRLNSTRQFALALAAPALSDDPAFTRKQGLLALGETQMHRELGVDPMKRLGRGTRQFDTKRYGGEIVKHAAQLGTVLSQYGPCSGAQVPLHSSGTDLAAKLREQEAKPLLIHAYDFSLNQQYFLVVDNSKIMESVYRQNPVQVGSITPDTVQTLVTAGEGFCLKGNGTVVFDVFEVDKDRTVLKMYIVQFVNQMPSADVSPPFQLAVKVRG